MGTVQCVITANFRLSRAFTGVSRISTGMRDCSTGEVSMKLLLLQKHEWVRTPVTTGGMQESLYGLDKLQQEEVWLTNVSSVTGKPNFLAEPDRGRGRVQTDRSRCKAGCLLWHCRYERRLVPACLSRKHSELYGIFCGSL